MKTIHRYIRRLICWLNTPSDEEVADKQRQDHRQFLIKQIRRMVIRPGMDFGASPEDAADMFFLLRDGSAVRAEHTGKMPMGADIQATLALLSWIAAGRPQGKNKHLVGESGPELVRPGGHAA